MNSDNRELNTLVGTGSFIQGTVNIHMSLRIDGRVVGEVISSGIITIGAEGEIEGNVQAQSVIIGGKVKGKVIAADKVVLEEQGILIGDLQANVVMVHEGAMFDGKCQMKDLSKTAKMEKNHAPKELPFKTE